MTRVDSATHADLITCPDPKTCAESYMFLPRSRDLRLLHNLRPFHVLRRLRDLRRSNGVRLLRDLHRCQDLRRFHDLRRPLPLPLP